MGNEITLNGTRYISAASASDSFHMTRDYIARLCRQNRVAGKRIGRSWFVAEQSLKEFIVSQQYVRTLRNEELSKERIGTYHYSQLPFDEDSSRDAASSGVSIKDQFENALTQPRRHAASTIASDLTNTPSGASYAALHMAHVPLYQIPPALEIIHKLIALLCACLFFTCGYAILDPSGLHTGTSFAEEGIGNLGRMAMESETKLPSDVSGFTAAAAYPINLINSVRHDIAIPRVLH